MLDPQNFVWVDIYDKTESDCEVSYALVKNVLDDANSTYIRCAATSNEETIYSNEVCVTILPEQEPAPQVTSFAPTRYLATETSKAPTKFAMPRGAVKEYVTITVKYLDIASLGGAEESAIYSPYTATIENGSSFRQSVVSPTFLGFAPYIDSNGDGVINDDDQSAATLNFNYDSVTENIEIKVYYKPIKVNFAVKYFFQNINDDLYVEDPSRYHTDKAETGTIVTNEYLESKAGVTTGFTKMYHIPENVAADGSTVFECYYDRNYYLIQFDLNGGYGVDPIYARYGTPFIVNNPIRHGYTFTGWKLIDIDINGNGEWDDTIPAGTSTDLISTIPEYNYYYQAQWETVNTTYTTVYWLKNANGGYDYLGSKIISEKSGETVSGSNDLANSPICGLAEHNHSEAAGCYGNCTATEHVCSIACYSNQLDDDDKADNLPNGNAKTVYGYLKDKVPTPEERNVYKYSYSSDWITTRYNFFFYEKTWYYLGTEDTYKGIDVQLNNPNLNNYRNAAATKNCGNATHTHSEDCLSCNLEVHAHGDSCETDTTYYVYERADSNVLVEGDGSTVVNVYYKPKEYIALLLC
ncbi:MAG: InlB B-repeat-containing protein, partial [Clostridia bacterium]|nr:InlB B-repeat-containing protein [Clostridia bacterium]